MGRPRQYEEDRITTAIRISPDLHDRFRDLADKRDVSVNYLINKAMQRYVDDALEDRQAS